MKMKRKISALAGGLLMAALWGGCSTDVQTGTASEIPKIEIVKNGQSDYQIVIPDKGKNKNIDVFINSSAKLLQDCVQETSGTKLPVLEESKADKNKPSIFIGDTLFAEKNGADIKNLKGWTYIEKTVGKNLILAGNDRPDVPDVNTVSHTKYILPTVKAVTSFLQDETGVKFVLPGPNGISVPKNTSISMPANLDVKKTPFLNFNTSRGTEPFYDIANNFFQCNSFKSYGGHSYYSAVPKEQYAATNPEYFALLGGKRNPTANHLCISNPEVQELIYKEMLKWLDQGYEYVELAQTDGYQPCQCENCKKLFGVSDFGEKTWILHKNLAERLLKDRPGKKVIIISYPPTFEPPATFTKFPKNVMIEMCKYNPDDFEKWKNYEVPCGFMTYVYNWGFYQIVGMTPRRTPTFCGKQAELFMKNNVKGVYKCGFGELFGLEGPAYYAYGRSFENPDKMIPAKVLLDEYCKAAFGEAYTPMKKFYDTLFERLELYSSITGAHCPYSEIIPSNPRITLAYTYSPELIETMEKNLARAEQLAVSDKVKKRLALVRMEFDYLRNLSRILTLYNAYTVSPDWTSFDKLAAEIEKRNAIIDGLYDTTGKIKRPSAWPDISFFGNIPKDLLKLNGRLRAPINSPLTWDTAKLKKNQTLPGSSKKKMTVYKSSEKVLMDGDLERGAWKNIPFEEMGEVQMGKTVQQTKFKMTYDNENLYLAFDGTLPPGELKINPCGNDGPCWGQECLEVFLDPFAGKEIYYHFIFNPAPNSRYDSINNLLIDPLDPKYGKENPSWNAEWEYANYIDSSKNQWKAIVKIPFKSLGVKTPGNGATWFINTAREHHIPGKKEIEYHLWSPNLETINFGDREAFGEIVFSEEKK